MAPLALLCGSLLLAPLLSFVPAVAHIVSAGAPAGTWRIDPGRSMIQFTVTKLGFADVHGRFLESSGTVRHDPVEPANSYVRWSVRVASVRTDATNRDRSLLAPEYFDAAQHPEMVFQSTSVRSVGEGRLEVTGTITLKGQARPLTLLAQPVQDGFETRFELDRYDFGIVGGRVMSRLIGRTIKVHLVAIAAREDGRQPRPALRPNTP